MPRLDYSTCKRCGRTTAEVGLMSRARYCEPCGEEIRIANNRQMIAHAGPYFERWRASMVACVGGYLDDGRAGT